MIKVLIGCLFAFIINSAYADGYYQLQVGNHSYPCSVGRSGIKAASEKKEGDGATPIGIYSFRKIYYRPDRISPNDITSKLPLIPLSKNDGWSDDSSRSEYNTFVKLPFSGSHENLWREDHVYDIIVVIGYNDNPPIKDKGSAIFLHIAREYYTPTAGCIGVSKEDLLKIISQLTPNSKIDIETSGIIKIINST